METVAQMPKKRLENEFRRFLTPLTKTCGTPLSSAAVAIYGKSRTRNMPLRVSFTPIGGNLCPENEDFLP